MSDPIRIGPSDYIELQTFCNHNFQDGECINCGILREEARQKMLQELGSSQEHVLAIPRKIIQIVSFPKAPDPQQQDMIVALCNDGTLWSLSLDDGSDWNLLNFPIPQRFI